MTRPTREEVANRPEGKEVLTRQTVRFGSEYQELKDLSEDGQFGKNLRCAVRNMVKAIKRRKK